MELNAPFLALYPPGTGAKESKVPTPPPACPITTSGGDINNHEKVNTVSIPCSISPNFNIENNHLTYTTALRK
jgi:hypothetical protein